MYDKPSVLSVVIVGLVLLSVIFVIIVVDSAILSHDKSVFCDENNFSGIKNYPKCFRNPRYPCHGIFDNFTIPINCDDY